MSAPETPGGGSDASAAADAERGRTAANPERGGTAASRGAADGVEPPVTLAELRTIDLFEGLDDAELEALCALAQPRTVAPGEAVVEQGEPPEGLQLLLAGEAQALLVEGARSEPVGRQYAPTWIGAIAVLTRRTLAVRMQAETQCRVATIPAAEFRGLAERHAAIAERVMRQVGPVASRITAIEQNRERLAALGTMAAGLAHELNNPAAAARRAASQLVEALEAIDTALSTFVEAGVERAEAAQLVELQREAMARAAAASALDALAAADAEEELLEHLEELDVSEPWRLAEPLAAAGVDQRWLERVAELAGPATGAALRWVAATLTAGRLSAELCASTERMTALVGAVKSYAYMDRGELVEVDLHEGIETTLTLLGHKLKHTSIEVRRDYDRALPRLTVHGSELNQVWTNLLDNAIDALGERGTLAIATHLDGSCAVVEIADDGPGIPAELVARIFDPFFTTKDVGHGTGLGLATARRIVVDRHDGSLTLESEPGRTVFRVSLPLDQSRGAVAAGASNSTAAGAGNTAAAGGQAQRGGSGDGAAGAGSAA
ncbi:MAG TPA: ATP-binding protein [Solirubrobacteraceae bacterium]|nr:ATP-binding protein [Solirubrobacteraceae bacterium]